MQSIDQVQAAWNALSAQAQIEAWDEFTRSIDYGDQGYDPFYLVLWPMWSAGVDPTEGLARPLVIEDEAPADIEAYMMPADMGGYDAYIPF